MCSESSNFQSQQYFNMLLKDTLTGTGIIWFSLLPTSPSSSDSSVISNSYKYSSPSRDLFPGLEQELEGPTSSISPGPNLYPKKFEDFTGNEIKMRATN